MITFTQFITCILAMAICSIAHAQSDSQSSAGPTEEPSAVTGPATCAIEADSIGQTKNVHRLNNLFFAGQFSQSDLAKIKEENIGRVISLRTRGEIDWDEKAAVEAAGLDFVDVPFLKPETLTDDVFDRVRQTLAKNDKPTLLHCGSANRVGGVWLPYRVLDQGVDLKTALKEAQVIGLKAPFIQSKAIDYIKRQQAIAKTDGEQSVNPGVNDKFTNPELDVDAFVKRFEIESREVYLNRETIVAACEIQKGDTIADVGAGTGLFSRMFSTAVGDAGWVYSIDIAPRFLSHINDEANKNKINNITSVLCTEDSVNLPPNSVHVVFTCDTYHHFEYPKSTLASIHRALKPGGRLIVVDFERIEGKSRKWTMGHVRAGKEVVRAEIQDAGFTLADEKQIDGFQENYFLMFRKE